MHTESKWPSNAHLTLSSALSGDHHAAVLSCMADTNPRLVGFLLWPGKGHVLTRFFCVALNNWGCGGLTGPIHH